jgi:hypothetical protein
VRIRNSRDDSCERRAPRNLPHVLTIRSPAFMLSCDTRAIYTRTTSVVVQVYISKSSIRGYQHLFLGFLLPEFIQFKFRQSLPTSDHLYPKVISPRSLTYRNKGRRWTASHLALIPSTPHDILPPSLDHPSSSNWANDRSEQDGPYDDQELLFRVQRVRRMVCNLRDSQHQH